MKKTEKKTGLHNPPPQSSRPVPGNSGYRLSLSLKEDSIRLGSNSFENILPLIDRVRFYPSHIDWDNAVPRIWNLQFSSLLLLKYHIHKLKYKLKISAVCFSFSCFCHTGYQLCKYVFCSVFSLQTCKLLIMLGIWCCLKK